MDQHCGSLRIFCRGIFEPDSKSSRQSAHAYLFRFACCYLHLAFGRGQNTRLLYVAEVLLTPNFEKKCAPPDGIPLANGGTLRLCSTHDFNLAGWIDSIVKIDGPYPKERFVDDINSGNLKPTVVNRFNEVFASTATGQHLLSDYYLVQDHVH